MREVINNNHRNDPPCRYAEQLVSFLYGEIEEAERAGFEAHMLNCASCADEIKGFAAVSSSIQEWRKLEFTPLATPAFEIPSTKNDLIAASGTGWLEAVRAFFSFPSGGWVPAATAAVPALLLVVGLIWFLAGSPPKTDEIAANVAETKDKPQFSQPNLPPAVNGDSTGETTRAAVTNKAKEQQAGSEPLDVASIKNRQVDDTPGTTAGNVDRNVNKNRQSALVRKTVSPIAAATAANSERVNKAVAKTPSSQPPPVRQPRRNKIPSLAIDEDEDDSLRLSDLLKEISLE